VETNRPDDVAQPMRSQVEQRDVRRKVCDEPDRRVRDDDLAAVRDRENPRRQMKGHAEQLVAHVGDLAGMNRHPDPDGTRCPARALPPGRAEPRRLLPPRRRPSR
jgi:hypothetical protein